MRTIRIQFALIFAYLCLVICAQRASGRGCLAEGTLVSTPDGQIPVEKLNVGDEVWSINLQGLHRATIKSKFQITAPTILEITAGNTTLRVTPEHPLQTGPGIFTEAGYIHPGDHLWLWQNGKLNQVAIDSFREISQRQPAYNLLVVPGGTYLANSFAVHNKGCFLPETPILKSDGSEIPISKIRPGDHVAAFTPDGHVTDTTVQDIVTVDVDDYCRVITDRLTLDVTEEHPFFVGNGTFKTVGALHVGDTVYAVANQHLVPQQIQSIQQIHQHTTVYNLQTDDPHTFFAHGIAVHNKGCFPAGTKIRTPTGEINIEKITPGQQIMGVEPDGRLVPASVEEIHETQSSILIIEAGKRVLRTTAEHPIALATGGFSRADTLRPGDQILALESNRLIPVRITSIRVTSSDIPVFNLSVDNPHTFIADNIVVHNKGGCFLPNTPILKPDGTQIPISQLRPGDQVAAFTSDGRIVATTVEDIFMIDVDDYCHVTTDHLTIDATEEHPFYVGNSTFKLLSDLRAGDRIYAVSNNHLLRQRIESIQPIHQHITVYNLQTGSPHTFFANGIAVHNKGGGFGGGRGYYGGHGSSTQPASAVGITLFMIVFLGIWLTVAIASSARHPMGGSQRTLFGSDRADEDLDYCFGRTKIQPKADQTRKLIEFLAKRDPTINPDTLIERARGTFTQLQQCWQARQYYPMQPLMMPDLYRSHLAQMDAMIRHHEIDHIENLQVISIDLVNVRYTNRPEQREFTALITASARDYYTDARSGRFIRGDQSPSKFQEFWIFHFVNCAWLLREIEQSRESDALSTSNLCEGMTQNQIEQIAGVSAAAVGAPWSDKKTSGQISRVQTQLEQLARQNPAWDRDAIMARTRDLFLSVLLAEEAADISKLNVADFTSSAWSQLQTLLNGKLSAGEAIEYRNLCVRKVDIALIQRNTKNNQSEFMARVSAHAQRFFFKSGSQLKNDPYELPFVNHVGFVLDGGVWKLNEMVPDSHNWNITVSSRTPTK